MKTIDPKFVAIVIIIMFSRLFFLEPTDTYMSVDPVNYIMGSQDYNLKGGLPHLPGSYLCCQIISFVNFFIDHFHTTLLCINLTWLFFSILLTNNLLIKYDIGNKNTVLIFLYSIPGIWFYTSITEIYAFDIFISTLLLSALLSKRYFLLTPFILAFTIAYRQSSGVFLSPLFLYFWFIYFKENGIKLKPILSLIFGLFSLSFMLYPMFENAGGISGYLKLYETMNPIPKLDFIRNSVQLVSFGFYFFFPLLFLLNRNGRLVIKHDLIFAILPALLAFVFLHYNKGYFMPLVVPIYIYSFLTFRPKKYILIVAIITNILVYFFLPIEIPNYQYSLNREIRNLSLFEVQKGRFLGKFASTYGVIQMNEDIYKDAEKLSLNSNKVIIEKNNLLLYQQLIYLKNIDSCFYFIKESDKINYYKFQGLKWSNSSINKIDPNLPIIGNKNIYLNHYKDFGLILDTSKYFVIYKIEDGEFDNYLQKFKEIY